MTPAVRQYLAVTGCYWAFTLSDGALRMLVLLYFYSLGYSPLQVATLFLLYEFFGIVTMVESAPMRSARVSSMRFPPW